MDPLRRWCSRSIEWLVLLAFAIGALPGIGGFLVLAAINEADWHTARLLLGLGLLTGALFAINIMFIYRHMAKRWNNYAGKNVKYLHGIDICLPTEQAFHACIVFLRSAPNCVVLTCDLHRGRIRAKIGCNLWTCGELIRIGIHENEEGQAHVDISSRCIMPNQRYDWGKNRANIERIVQFLETLAARR